MILSAIEDLVPSDHLVRKIEDCIDLSFIETDIKNKQQHQELTPPLKGRATSYTFIAAKNSPLVSQV